MTLLHDHLFQQKIEEISGENFRKCMQCGQCTGLCPMLEAMDLTPRQILCLLQFGQSQMILSSKTPWVCATCHTCMVNCTRGVDLTRIMEALRLITLRQNKDRVHPASVPKKEIERMPQIALVSAFRKLTA